ncbi:MAG TPA: DUF1007 family protein [Burkholderiaceae bacterium]|nr:DUF1007 family protein [Burkholderiaceae bacterium]
MKTISIVRRCARRGVAWLAACVVLSAVAMPPGASAHPHVRMQYQVDPQLEHGRVVGIRVVWTMDPMTSMLIARGIDVNGNGALDAEELAAFGAGNQAVLAANRWFLSVRDDAGAVGFPGRCADCGARNGRGDRAGVRRVVRAAVGRQPRNPVLRPQLVRRAGGGRAGARGRLRAALRCACSCRRPTAGAPNRFPSWA